MILFLLLLVALAIAGATASVHALLRDGYRCRDDAPRSHPVGG
jgi:hypothetical protein